MTDSKSTPKAKTPAAKDDTAPVTGPAVHDHRNDDAENVTATADLEDEKSGDRDDVIDGQQVQERDDLGAAAEPDGPDTVKLITEVRPGLAN